MRASLKHAQNKERKEKQAAHRKPIIERLLVLGDHPPLGGFAREGGQNYTDCQPVPNQLEQARLFRRYMAGTCGEEGGYGH